MSLSVAGLRVDPLAAGVIFAAGAATALAARALFAAPARTAASSAAPALPASAITETNPYESEKMLSEYMVFHYSPDYELLPWAFNINENHDQADPQHPVINIVDAIDFPVRCARVASKYAPKKGAQKSRALDLGCAVGRSTFEMARDFDEVIGLDFSHSFVRAASQLAAEGSMTYHIYDCGDLHREQLAVIDRSIVRCCVWQCRHKSCILHVVSSSTMFMVCSFFLGVVIDDLFHRHTHTHTDAPRIAPECPSSKAMPTTCPAPSASSTSSSQPI
jgi:SAM-dependent methyltransferase